jgi:hypothetical protein
MNIKYVLFLAIFSIASIGHAGNQTELRKQAESNYAWEQTVQTIQKGFAILPWVAGNAVIKYFENKADENRSSLAKFAIVGLGGIFNTHMLAQTLSKPIQTVFNTVASWVTSKLSGSTAEEDKNPVSNLLVNLEILRLKYYQTKHRLSADTQALFEKLQGSVQEAKIQSRRMILAGLDDEQSASDNLRKQLKPIESVMRILLDLPQGTTDVDLNDNLISKLQPILERYSPQIQKDIKLLTAKIASSSKMTKGQKAVVYLIGEPGTGKTTFAELFSGALGLPLINILDIEKALEVKERLFNYGDSMNDSFRLSLLTEALRNKPRNSILFLDELEKVFNRDQSKFAMQSVNLESFLHQLLDPNKDTIRLPDLDIEIDISGLIIMAAGNSRLNSSSLNNRMTELEFPCIEKEKRVLIAQKRFAAQMAVRPTLKSCGDDTVMIEQIAALDPYCGVRSLEFVVDDYIEWKFLQQTNWKTDNNFDIMMSYQKHPSKGIKSALIEQPSFWSKLWEEST